MSSELRWTEDGEHVFIDGKQFIGLKRFHQALSELKNNNNILDEENKRLTEENKVLKEAIRIMNT